MSCPLGGQDINLISWWLTSPFSCMMGWGSLPQPGPAGASPAPMVLPRRWQSCISPQDSAALLSGAMLRDHRLFEVCFSQLNQEEMVCPHLGFGKGNVKLVAWLVFFLLSLESMQTTHLHCSLWSHCASHAQWQHCAVRPKVLVSLEAAGRKYLLNLKFGNSGTRSLNHPAT